MSRFEPMIKIAWSYLGTMYRWGGDDPSGFDCSGFVIEVLQSVGLLPEGFDKMKLAKDAAFDRGPSIPGKEAQEYYDKTKSEIAENKTQGFGFDIPWDWADD